MKVALCDLCGKRADYYHLEKRLHGEPVRALSKVETSDGRGGGMKADVCLVCFDSIAREIGEAVANIKRARGGR